MRRSRRLEGGAGPSATSFVGHMPSLAISMTGSFFNPWVVMLLVKPNAMETKIKHPIEVPGQTGRWPSYERSLVTLLNDQLAEIGDLLLHEGLELVD